MSNRYLNPFTALVLAAVAAAVPARANIVGGHNINISEAPYQLHLSVDLGDGVSSGCGAAWLGGAWVVTAHHCVEEGASPASNATLIGGITKMSEDKASLRVKAKRIITYNTNVDLGKGDIALIELVSPITASLAKPIRWATAADVTAGLTKPGAWCWATGWGFVNKDYDSVDPLQGVESVIYNSNQTYVIQWAGQGGTKEIGSCQGDSGGPLVVKDGAGNFVLVGISSYIQSFCGDPKNPSSYCRVSAFDSWIRTTTGIATGVTYAPRDYAIVGGDRIRMNRARQLEFSFANLTGAQVLRLDRFYAAGEHALPAAGLPAGNYVLRVRGDKLDLQQALTIRK